MSQNKKIAKNSAILYVRLVITTIIELYALRIVIRNLGVSDYGLYSVVGSIVFMTSFLNTVMITTTYRYIAYEMGKENGRHVNKVFNISLTIHIFLAFLILLIAETAGIWYINNHLKVGIGKLPDAIFVFRFSVLATLFNVLSVPYQGLITAQENFSVRAVIEIIRSVVFLVLLVFLTLNIGYKLRIYAVIMLVVGSLRSLLFIIYCKMKYRLITIWKFSKDKQKYKEMISFSGWTMIGAAAEVGKSTGSPIIINLFFGTVVNASFGVSNRINHFLLTFINSLGQATIPQIIKSFSSGNQQRTLNLVAYLSKYSFFLLYLISFPLLLEMNYILKIWLGIIPDYAILFCKLTIINSLIVSLGAGSPAAIQASGKIKWFQIINSSILLSGLPLSFLFLKLNYPPYYLLIVYIILGIINRIVNLVLLHIIIKFDVIYLLKKSYMRVIIVFVLTLPFFKIHTFFSESLGRFIISITMSIIYYIFLLYYIGLEKKEKVIVRDGFVSLKNKIKPRRI
jgi:O-antigen/teichoic acid export membrane protein